MTLPKYSMSAMLLVILIAVVHVNQYVFPRTMPYSSLFKHAVLIGYLLYGAYQYRKHMHWDYKKADRRKSQRDPSLSPNIYGRIAAEKAMAEWTGSLEELVKVIPANSPEYLAGYQARIKEEIDRKVITAGKTG